MGQDVTKLVQKYSSTMMLRRNEIKEIRFQKFLKQVTYFKELLP